MYTAGDCTEYLMDSVGGGAQDSEHRVLRQAVFHGYRDLIAVRDWRWYETHDFVDVDENYVEHLLPWGVQSVDSFQISEPVGWNVLGRYIHPREFARVLNSDLKEVSGYLYTIQKSDQITTDRYVLRIICGNGFLPSRATLTYRRRPRDLRLNGYERNSRAGTLSWTGNEVRGTDTKFSQQMVGAVLRVSNNEDAPEGLTGMNPYVAEGIIYQVVDSTKCYAWSPDGPQDFADTAYTVSDVLDFSPGMYTAMLTGSEVWAARLLGKNVDGAYGLYGRDLRMAYESDAVAALSGREHQYASGAAFWYLRPGVDGGTGCCGDGTGGPLEGPCPIKPPIWGGDADSDQTGEFTGSASGGNASSSFDDCGNPA